MSRFIRGARIKDVVQALEEVMPIEHVKPAPKSYQAVKLAYDNKHKPWARRWLRLNRPSGWM